MIYWLDIVLNNSIKINDHLNGVRRIMSSKLYNIIARVMGVQLSQINDQSSPESIDSWTSFNGYVLLFELETEFNVKFTLDEAIDVKKVADIKRHLRNHGVVLND